MAHDETAQAASVGPSLNELAGKASASAAWAIFSHGGGQIVRLASNLIVTRLLFTEYCGLMALVNVYLLGLELFSDIGIGPALVQSKRDDPDFVNTVWTMQVVRGLALCSIAMVVAVPFADFYEQPILVSLIRVTALNAVIQGFTSPAIFIQMRELRLKRPEILQFGTLLTGAVVTVAVAWVTRSIWSLVAGGIVASMVRTVLSHVWLPGIRSRFRFDREAARYVLSFGSWILLSTMAVFAANELDRLIFGKLTTMATLGVYSIAAMIALVPTDVLRTLSGKVLFPLYSRARHSSSDLEQVFLNARRPLLVIGGWATAGLLAGGPTIVRLLYDPRYWEAGWMLQILAAGLWFGLVLGGTAGSIVLAKGRSDWVAAMGFSKVLGMAAFMPLGYWLGGFPGAVAGFSMSELARYGVAQFSAVKMGFDGRHQDLEFSIRLVISAIVAWLAVRWLDDLGITHVLVHSVVIFVVVTAFWARPLGVLVGRARRGEPLFSVDSQP